MGLGCNLLHLQRSSRPSFSPEASPLHLHRSPEISGAGRGPFHFVFLLICGAQCRNDVRTFVVVPSRAFMPSASRCPLFSQPGLHLKRCCLLCLDRGVSGQLVNSQSVAADCLFCVLVLSLIADLRNPNTNHSFLPSRAPIPSSHPSEPPILACSSKSAHLGIPLNPLPS